MLRNMTYECDKENVTSVKDKIMDRIEFHEISIGSDLWDDIFNGCLHAWIQIFSGEKEKDNVCQWRWGGGWAPLFPIIWFTMWSNKLYNFQSLVGVSASISPFRPGHGHYHAYNRTKQWTFIQPFLIVINTYRSWRINYHLIFWQYEMSI